MVRCFAWTKSGQFRLLITATTGSNRYGFGRLIKITNRVNALVKQFWYDGLGERISWKYDSNSDHTVDGSDKKYHFAYDDQWRLVMVFRESDTSPKEEHFFHAAGLDGQGGSSYIDTEVLRDKDSNSGWTSAADGTLEQRYYINQNWRADAVALVTSTGVQVEGDRHFAYGTPFGMCAGDVNGDGRVNSTDTTQIQTWVTGSAYDSRGDLDRDGDVDLTDKSTATTNVGINLGLGLLSSSTVFNRKGYAGYSFDPITSYAMFDVRHRTFNADLGRWITRDPLGYVDGANLYEYCGGDPLSNFDPMGTAGEPCNDANIAKAKAKLKYLLDLIARECGNGFVPDIKCCPKAGGDVNCCQPKPGDPPNIWNVGCNEGTWDPVTQKFTVKGVCLCTDQNGDTEKPILTILEHELQHVWQQCKQNKTPFIDPQWVMPEIGVCFELGVWCGEGNCKGGKEADCDKFCKSGRAPGVGPWPTPGTIPNDQELGGYGSCMVDCRKVYDSCKTIFPPKAPTATNPASQSRSDALSTCGGCSGLRLQMFGL